MLSATGNPLCYACINSYTRPVFIITIIITFIRHIMRLLHLLLIMGVAILQLILIGCLLPRLRTLIISIGWISNNWLLKSIPVLWLDLGWYLWNEDVPPGLSLLANHSCVRQTRLRPADSRMACDHDPYSAGRSKYNISLTPVSDIPNDSYLDVRARLEPGGHFLPWTCTPQQRALIIVPYRDRSRHLGILLNNIHRFMIDQNLEYKIIVVEQAANQTFNRGKLFNAGFTEAWRTDPCAFDCLILHDVDLVPEGGGGPSYLCQDQPKLLAFNQSQFNYSSPYNGYFGGVISVRTDQYIQMNGYSNLYWGWGGEDDDFYYRARYNGWFNQSLGKSAGKYFMVDHKPHAGQDINPCRYHLLHGVYWRWKTDGLNSVDYHVIQRHLTSPWYSWVTVDLRELSSQQLVQELGYCSPDLGTLLIIAIVGFLGIYLAIIYLSRSYWFSRRYLMLITVLRRSPRTLTRRFLVVTS